MTSTKLARQLLVDAPDVAFCDACLALACGTTRTEMRETTKVLLRHVASFHRASTCASCRRTVRATVYQLSSKCAQCSGPFDVADPGLVMGGERFHLSCMRRLLTDETIRLSRAVTRRSRGLIEQSRRRIRDGYAWPELDMTGGFTRSTPSAQ